MPCISAKSLALSAGVLSLFIIGCGDSGPITVPVGGVITIGGEQPPARGTVYFTPIEPAPGHSTRPATATFDTSGRYSVKTSEEGDGLVPGRYKVGIHCWKVAPQMGGPPPVSYIRQSFTSAQTSGLEIVVKPDEKGTIEKDYDVPKP